MATRLAFWRWASVVAAIAAALIVVGYLSDPFAMPTKRESLLFIPADMLYEALSDHSLPSVIGPLVLISTSTILLGSCAMVFVLAMGSTQVAARIWLAGGFAFSAAAFAIFYLLEPLAQVRSFFGIGDSPSLLALARFAGAALLALGSVMGLRLFLVYPNTILEDDYHRHDAAQWLKMGAKTSRGWRAKVYPARWQDGAAGAAYAEERYKSNIRFFRWLASSWPIFVGVVSAVLAAPAFIATRNTDLQGMEVLFWLPVPVLVTTFAFRLLMLQRDQGSAEVRHRLSWITGSLFVGGTIIGASVMASWALVSSWATISPNSLTRHGGESIVAAAMTLPSGVSVVLFYALIVASFSLSIFYRGAVDPSLAARRITVWGVLAVVVAFLFVLIERTIASRVIAWLGLSPDSGAIVAGAFIAVSIAPIRSRTEKLVHRAAERLLPLDSLVQGTRKTVAIAFSDLSGYTALSARDEQSAHLMAALLQKQARAVSDKHELRLVKAMGDAVMLESTEAKAMAAGILELHAAFPKAAQVLGIDPLPVHSGIHCGEVTEAADGDLYGQAVNLAARIQGEARPGQIACSREFLEAAGIAMAAAEFLGERRMKNVPAPMSCYALPLQPESGAAAAALPAISFP